MKRLLTFGAVILLFAGCAGPNAHPPVAEANTGYVDFHADRQDELSWEVSQFDERAQDFKRLHSELKPPAGGVLRLAFAPGAYRLRVSFLNRVVLEPAIVEVQVKDGMVTPVRVVLTAEGTALVQRSEEKLGPTGKGRFGNRTRFSADESSTYRLNVEAQSPLPYQAIERMPYSH